jgi:hypothetical protein
MQQPPEQPPPPDEPSFEPPPFQQPPIQQPNYQQPPFQQSPYYQAPYMQPPMPYDPGLRSKAVRGNVLMFGLVGFALVVIGTFVASFLNSQVLIYCNCLGVPVLVGLLAGNAAINGRLAENSQQAAMQGASSAGFTAALFAGICGTCVLLSTIAIADSLDEAGGSLNDMFELADISAAMLVLVYLGVWIVGILLYMALGALGGITAGFLKKV